MIIVGTGSRPQAESERANLFDVIHIDLRFYLTFIIMRIIMSNGVDRGRACGDVGRVGG